MNNENEILENETEFSTGMSPILTVGITDDGQYNVQVSGNASVSEVAFCMMVIIKCLDRDEIIKSDEMLDLINKYLSDPQYEELKS